MVREPIEQRGGHLGIAEHLGSFAEAEVGGDDGAGTLEREHEAWNSDTKKSVSRQSGVSILSLETGDVRSGPKAQRGAHRRHDRRLQRLPVKGLDRDC